MESSDDTLRSSYERGAQRHLRPQRSRSRSIDVGEAIEHHRETEDATSLAGIEQRLEDKEGTFSPPAEERLHSRTSDVGEAIERHYSTEDAASLASIDRPPSKAEVKEPEALVFTPYSPEVLLLLAPASIFGVLARLGLLALFKYDGESIFPLAYPQALGCLFMGMALILKEPLGNL